MECKALSHYFAIFPPLTFFGLLFNFPQSYPQAGADEKQRPHDTRFYTP